MDILTNLEPIINLKPTLEPTISVSAIDINVL